MVLYTCDRCRKEFSKKNIYEKHLKRVFPCQINEDHENNCKNDYNCNICNKKYRRIDTLKRHNESKKHKLNTILFKKTKNIITNNNDTMNAGNDINKINVKKSNIMINSNNINSNNNINNNNNNYYFITPFGQEGIANLTSLEKMSTLLSKENPIVEIILITNLNPNKPEYHNIGYTDLKSGYGIMFNGKTWEKKEINAMMNELLMIKKDDLFKIRLEISPYLSDEHKKIIEEKLQNVENNVEPKIEHYIQSKKKLIKNLKTHFTNNHTMIKEAVKKSGAPIKGINNDASNSWMNEYDFEDIDKKIKIINAKKQSATNMLEYIDHIDHKTLIKIINTAQNLEEINVIDRLIMRSIIDKNDINENMIRQQIKKDMEINKIIFEKYD